MLAETTWLLDVQHTDDELFAGMKKNHRNLIRRCEREGVRIVQTTDTAALQRLNDMHDATAVKHNFHRFSRTYIDAEFAAYARAGDAVIFEAYLPDGTLDASSIIMFAGTMGAYRHSASRNTNPKLPTSYLIQWHALTESRRRGKTAYNFWGIAPDDAPGSHPFAGITHFKKGFGGYHKDLVHCMDLPITWRYWQTWVVETVRRIKRGF
jgi:lipid II:glycine glycyltransferase (peptidoglycan interpeptide bridge formation enzyme)